MIQFLFSIFSMKEIFSIVSPSTFHLAPRSLYLGPWSCFKAHIYKFNHLTVYKDCAWPLVSASRMALSGFMSMSLSNICLKTNYRENAIHHNIQQNTFKMFGKTFRVHSYLLSCKKAQNQRKTCTSPEQELYWITCAVAQPFNWRCTCAHEFEAG